jgi:aspartate-semialdehyde dehydrogenase
MPIAPINQIFKINKLAVVSLQAVSGAGHPGIPFLDIYDNVIPFIGGEEEKVENESRLLLGSLQGLEQKPSEMVISAQTNRVNVSHGHTVCLSIGFEKAPSIEEAIQIMKEHKGPEIAQNLPSSPNGNVIIVRDEDNRPQPRRDRDTDKGMVCTVGRVRPCSILDIKMVSVAHNAIRGAAGGSVLNAEMLVKAGYIK